MRVDQLRLDRENRRKRTPRGRDMIVQALKDVGAARSIVIDELDTVLAGNGVVDAAAEAGIEKLRVIETDGKEIIAIRRRGLSRKEKRAHAMKEHPAAFPVELPRAVMAFLTSPSETVFDPFGGSGSTIIACEQMKRVARVVELDPLYCQIAIDRWEAFTGKSAKQIGTASSGTGSRKRSA